jgi:hypothetical protein
MPDEKMTVEQYRRAIGQAAPGDDRKRPPKAPPVQRELSLQMASFAWLESLEWPDKKPVYTHPANERGDKMGAVLAWKCGTRSGTPDWIFWLPNGLTLQIELKAEGGSLSDDQKAFRDELKELGHPYRVEKSIRGMAVALSDWGVLFRETPTSVAIREAWS